MSSGASKAGFTSRDHPSGMSAVSRRSTIWLRVLFIDRLTEYGSVTTLSTSRPSAGANTRTR